MKNILTYKLKLLVVFFGIVTMLGSCKKDEIVDAEYPDQLIYMPAAKNGFFVINSVALPVGTTTPGNAYRYKADLIAKKFIIPLGVYRSGINNDGGFTVSVAVNSDTISKLQAVAKLPAGTLLLPSNKYTIVPSVEMKNGEEIATFDLTIDLDFLIANYGNSYAIGISVSSVSRQTNKKLATTIVVIDTNFLKPVTGFTLKPDVSNDRKIVFTNTTIGGLTFSWNFGDGSPVSTEISPNHTFPTYGTYEVILTAKGVSGDVNTFSQTYKIWENVTNTYFKNSGNPFLRSDVNTPLSEQMGTLKDWLITPNILYAGDNTRGGYSTDLGGSMHFESTPWDATGLGLNNGKIYQTFTLPKGNYKVSFFLSGIGSYGSSEDWGNYNANFVASAGSIIPNIEDLNGSNILSKISGGLNDFVENTEYTMEFTLTQPTEVAIGFVLKYGALTYTRIAYVNMIKS